MRLPGPTVARRECRTETPPTPAMPPRAAAPADAQLKEREGQHHDPNRSTDANPLFCQITTRTFHIGPLALWIRLEVHHSTVIDRNCRCLRRKPLQKLLALSRRSWQYSSFGP